MLFIGCTIQPAPEVKKETQEPIKIGAVAPLTGDVAVMGLPVINAVELAVDGINAQGGINGRQVQLIAEDGMCAGKEATSAMQKLVNVDNVVGVIGGLCSAETLPMAGLAEETHTVIISPSATSPAIKEAGDYVFRVVVSDSFQGEQGVLLANRLGYKKAATLYTNDEYGSALQQVFADEFTDFGGEVVAQEAFEKSAKDFRTQLTKIKPLEPDVIYIVAFPKEAGVLLKQAKELGVDVQIIAAEGAFDSETIEVAGDSAEGLLVTIPKTLEDSPKYLALKQAYNYAYDEDPGVYTGEAHDALNILAIAITNSDGTKESIKDEVYKVKYDGISGRIEFDEFGEVITKTYAIKIVENGEFVDYKG